MTQLNYHHLFYFWTVAKDGHLTRSAARLGVSQSALSIQIKLLEKSIGHPLFVRDGRRLHLTEAGQITLGFAETIFTAGSELMSMLSSQEGAHRRTIRIGSVATLSRNFQEGFIGSLLAHPEIELVLESAGLEELLVRLQNYKLHLVLSNQPVSSGDGETWRCRRIARQPVCLVGPPRTKRNPFRFPEDLREVRLIVPGTSSDIRSAFDLFLEKKNISPHIFAQVDDMALLRLLARDSGAVALTPEVVVKDELANGTLQKYCRVPGISESFYAITRVRSFEPPLLKEILR